MKNNTELNIGDRGVNPIEEKGTAFELGKQIERLRTNVAEISEFILKKKGQFSEKIEAFISYVGEIIYPISMIDNLQVKTQMSNEEWKALSARLDEGFRKARENDEREKKLNEGKTEEEINHDLFLENLKGTVDFLRYRQKSLELGQEAADLIFKK